MNSKFIFSAFIFGQSLCLQAQTSTEFSKLVGGSLEPVKVVSIETWKNQMPPESPKNYAALSVVVSSKGCTSASDFKVNVQGLNGVKFVSIVRTRLDVCSAPAEDMEVQLASPGLNKDDRVVILNPFPVIDLGSVY